MAARKRREDIRAIFGELADDVALDDRQSAAVCGVSVPTWKRWRRLKKGPPVISLNGLPRQLVGDLRRGCEEPQRHPNKRNGRQQTPTAAGIFRKSQKRDSPKPTVKRKAARTLNEETSPMRTSAHLPPERLALLANASMPSANVRCLNSFASSSAVRASPRP